MNRVPASHRVPTASRPKDAVSGPASRETSENGVPRPSTASPRPTASRPRPDQRTRFRDEHALPRPALSIKRDAGRGESAASLNDWIDSLKNRQLTITSAPDGPRLTGPANNITTNDWDQLQRHHHALTTAAAGTHPTWWNYILGRADQLDADDVPDGCTSCGTTGWAHATPDGLPWCDTCWNDLEVPA